MQDKQGSMLLAHNVVGCLLPFIFFGGVVMMGILGIMGNRHNGHIRHIRHNRHNRHIRHRQ